MAGVTKLSVSVPTRVWQEVERLLGRPGETRSALVSRVLDQAAKAAQDAEIRAEYAQAYSQQPETDDEKAAHRGLLESTRRRFTELDERESGVQAVAPRSRRRPSHAPG